MLLLHFHSLVGKFSLKKINLVCYQQILVVTKMDATVGGHSG